MTPLEAMDHAIMAALAFSGERKPGAVIRRLPTEVREALEGLTSDELTRLRCDWPTAKRAPAR
jgi:hypothetical protein